MLTESACRPWTVSGQIAWDAHEDEGVAGRPLATETRVRATDQAAGRAFRRYWRVVGPFSGVVRRRTLALIAADLAGKGGT